MESSCYRCYHHQPNPTDDIFFQKSVKPLMYFCCVILPSAYLIGIWFSLRTHVKQIWHEPQQPSIRDSSIYRKLLPIHIVQQLLHYGSGGQPASAHHPAANSNDAELGNFHGNNTGIQPSMDYQATSINGRLHERHPPNSAPPTTTHHVSGPASDLHPAAHGLLSSMDHDSLKHEQDDDGGEEHAGHDSPNWSKAKSATVLLSCTVLYAIIAGKATS
jgi:Ca2+:H+ antiporter